MTSRKACWGGGMDGFPEASSKELAWSAVNDQPEGTCGSIPPEAFQNPDLPAGV